MIPEAKQIPAIQIAWEKLSTSQQEQLTRLLGHLLYQQLAAQKRVVGQQMAREEQNERPSANQ